MKYTYLLLSTICVLFACQPEVGGGIVIIYGDVIGSYEGHCANYSTSTSDLMNREESTLSVSAVNTEEASVKTSCDRFDDQQLTIRSSSASEIFFEKILSDNSVISLRYIAASDSLVLTQKGSGDNNLIFAGVRK
ncbi:MAG: hypothetical protein ACI86M_003995 [Saprospiraceae bacterium]